MSIVKIVNVGTRTVTFNGNERVTLAPSESRLVPWEFAVSWLGNPATEGADRVYEYDLTRLLWGYSAGIDTIESFEADKRPHVEVYSTDEVDEEGQPVRLFMLLEDPDGLKAAHVPSSSDPNLEADVATLRRQLAEQSAAMARLEAMIASKVDAPQDPATSTALATALDGGGTSDTELPKPVPTPTDAADRPRAGRVRGQG